MAEHLKLINPDPAPATGRFVMTETAADILRSLRMVQGSEDGYGTVIAGCSGSGKTEALYEFLRGATKHAVMHTAVAGEATPFGVSFGLMRALDLSEPNNCQLAAGRLKIAEAIGVGGTLIIDEAQNLVQHKRGGGSNFEMLEWLRETAREGCFSLSVCGDLKLLDAMSALPQFRNRMRRPVIVRHVPKADVALLASRRGVFDAETVEALALVARRHGGLRDVAHTLAHAAIFARGGPIELGHVLASIEDLKLGPKGGK